LLEVKDVLGRNIHRQQDVFNIAGKQTIALDVEHLRAGTYLLQVNVAGKLTVHKLTVIH
jgi:hypothetical protein